MCFQTDTEPSFCVVACKSSVVHFMYTRRMMNQSASSLTMYVKHQELTLVSPSYPCTRRGWFYSISTYYTSNYI